MPVQIESMPIYIFLVSSLLVHFMSYTPCLIHCPNHLPTFCTQFFALNPMYPMQLCCLSLICYFDNFIMDSLLPKERLGLTGTRGILGGREAFISGKHTLGEDTNVNTLRSCCWFHLSIVFSSTFASKYHGATCLSIFPLSDHSFDCGSWTMTWLPGWNFLKTFWLGNFTSCLCFNFILSCKRSHWGFKGLDMWNLGKLSCNLQFTSSWAGDDPQFNGELRRIKSPI